MNSYFERTVRTRGFVEIGFGLRCCGGCQQCPVNPGNSTFHDLAEAVRGALAAGCLANPGVLISEVAVLLGVSEQSAFKRAIRRWTGETPGRWRRRQGHSVGA